MEAEPESKSHECWDRFVLWLRIQTLLGEISVAEIRLIVHVLLGPLKGKYTNVDSPSERPIDVRDGEQNKRDQQREGEDL